MIIDNSHDRRKLFLYHKIDNHSLLEGIGFCWTAKHFLSNWILESVWALDR